jgi:hypothetical protein
MRNRLHVLSLFPLACLIGCSLPYTQPTQTITGNWQIQSGTAITPTATAAYLTGALQNQGGQVTGTLSYTAGDPLSFTGTFDSTKGILALTSTTENSYNLQLTVPSDYNNLSTGTLIVAGTYNPLVTTTSVVAVEVAPLNGTYTGTLSGTLTTYTSGTLTTAPISGTVSLALTQSTTPNSNGQFPLTGTITFPSGSGMSPVTLPGLISGIPIWLNNEPCVTEFSEYAVCTISSQTGSTLNAYTNPTATQIAITNLHNSSVSGTTNTGITLTGTLTLQ